MKGSNLVITPATVSAFLLRTSEFLFLASLVCFIIGNRSIAGKLAIGGAATTAVNAANAVYAHRSGKKIASRTSEQHGKKAGEPKTIGDFFDELYEREDSSDKE